MYTLRRYRFLADVGWFENWRTKRSIDGAGNPISWIAYQCLSVLSHWIDPRLEVLSFDVDIQPCGGRIEYQELCAASMIRSGIRDKAPGKTECAICDEREPSKYLKWTYVIA